MRRDKAKHNWLIDAALFAGFLGSLWLDLTGVAAHQWLGVAVGVLAGYHLWAHRGWVKAVTGRFLGHANRQSRVFYLVDAGLAAGFAAIGLTGLAISTWLDLSLASYAAWHTVHVAASAGTLALLVAKIGLHWRWIIGVARRSIFPARGPAARPGAAAPRPALAAAPLGRRDFVRLMAGVGALALVAGTNALAGLTGEAAAARPATADQAQTAASAPESWPASGATSGTCVVRCGRRCAYPGQCRRYADRDGDGRCDLGECLS